MIHLRGLSAGPMAPRHDEAAAVAQAEAVFDALEADLAAQGGQLTDLCKITMQLTDRAYRQAVYGVMGRRLMGVRPVSTGLIVAGLQDPAALFQLDAFAVPGGPHQRLRPYRSSSMPYGLAKQPFEAEFCMVVVARARIFLRGQTGLTLDGRFTTTGDAAGQARIARANVVALLGEAGATLENAVHATVYVTDRAFIAPVMAALDLPVLPHTLFVVKGLAAPELLMEVDVHAVL